MCPLEKTTRLHRDNRYHTLSPICLGGLNRRININFHLEKKTIDLIYREKAFKIVNDPYSLVFQIGFACFTMLASSELMLKKIKNYGNLLLKY